jgi:hypothetical protein
MYVIRDYKSQTFLSRNTVNRSAASLVEGLMDGMYTYVVMKLSSSSTEEYRRFQRSTVSIFWAEERIHPPSPPANRTVPLCLPRNVQEAYASTDPCITLGPRWWAA